MMSWVKMIFYFGGMLKAIYTVHWYSFHSFGTCQESFVIVSFEWGIETLIWRREQTISYDRGCIAACRFSGVWNPHCLCLECHGKAACRSDPKHMYDDDYYLIGHTYLTLFFRYFDTCRCQALCVVTSSAVGLKAAGTLMTWPDLPSNSSCRVHLVISQSGTVAVLQLQLLCYRTVAASGCKRLLMMEHLPQ